jgi:hypothetical protein
VEDNAEGFVARSQRGVCSDVLSKRQKEAGSFKTSLTFSFYGNRERSKLSSARGGRRYACEDEQGEEGSGDLCAGRCHENGERGDASPALSVNVEVYVWNTVTRIS